MTPTRTARIADLASDQAPFVASPKNGGSFHNPWGSEPARPFTDLLRWKTGANPFAKDKRTRRPNIPVVDDPRGAWSTTTPGARIQWLGHAALRVEIDGVTAVIDPTFGRVGPFPGMPRLVPAPLRVEALGHVDAVLLTHGHYDHLDKRSLDALARANPEAPFFVPLGQERPMPRGATVVSFDWWESVHIGDVEICFVPAQHWHRRGVDDMNKALWGGWVIAGTRSVYHSGDTGFFGGFRAIGAAFPSLDAAVLPLGAYEPRWFMSAQHMAPEEAVQALVDLGAKRLVGMHWGTFDLTDEPLDHGAFTLLPETLEARAVDNDRAIVVAHGGVVDLRTGEAIGRV